MVWIAGISIVVLSWNAMTDAISAATMGRSGSSTLHGRGPPDVDSARGCWLTAIAPWLNADAALSIRRATGEEVLTVFSPNEEWSVYVQPGGAITSAFVGTPSDAIVWVNATDRRVERDEDGTYVIRIDAQFSPAARAVS